MSLFSRVLGSGSGGKVFVLGLDGLPFSFLQRSFEEERFPNLRRLSRDGRFTRMTSVIPTVSSVAWSTYMTGKNPGKHGIYGFVDRLSDSYDIFVPTSLNMTSDTLWEIIGRSGKKVIVVNVPVTYPPREVNGILVSGFLCTNMDKLAYPPEISALLKGLGYRIDIDAKQARVSRDTLMEDAHETLDRRFTAAFHLMDEKPWDFFQLHVMETDRVNHFLWAEFEEGGAYREAFLNFYGRIDEYVGELDRRLPKDALLVILSDHGFCSLKKEVYLNQWLLESGFLKVPQGEGLGRLLAESRAYSLIPGRLYVNLMGREPRGSVDKGEYQAVREELAEALAGLTDPEDGTRVIQEVVPGEEIYHREGGFDGAAGGGDVYPPDLVAVPVDGYDLKGNVWTDSVFGKTELVGMHTYDDAFLLVRGGGPDIQRVPSIADLTPSILEWMQVPQPADLDGQTLKF